MSVNQTESEKDAFSQVRAKIQENKIKFLRVLFVDNANVIRAKSCHVSSLEKIREDGIGITMAHPAFPVMFDGCAPNSGYSPIGEIRLMPVWNTFHLLPYCTGHAAVFGEFIVKDQIQAACPRSFLKRMIVEAGKFGIQVKAAFEEEFCLMTSIEKGVAIPVDDTLFASAYSMDKNAHIISDITDYMLTEGMIPELYHPESAPGQQEISWEYTDVLTAAENHIKFREIAHAVAQKHGVLANFMPKVYPTAAGNGAHIHMSIWKNEKNITGDPSDKEAQLSTDARSFIAGILHHLPGLMAITTPSTNSFRRILPDYWSGAYQCWGIDNREAALRVPLANHGPTTNWELKTCDHTSNPYLALGCIIAAGLDGLKNGMKLLEPCQTFPSTLSEDDKKRLGIALLPTSLAVAIDKLENDTVLKDALGPELAKAYIAVKRFEEAFFKDKSLEDELQMLHNRY